MTRKSKRKRDIKAIAGEKVKQLTKDPGKTVEAARSLFDRFRKPKE